MRTPIKVPVLLLVLIPAFLGSCFCHEGPPSVDIKIEPATPPLAFAVPENLDEVLPEDYQERCAFIESWVNTGYGPSIDFTIPTVAVTISVGIKEQSGLQGAGLTLTRWNYPNGIDEENNPDDVSPSLTVFNYINLMDKLYQHKAVLSSHTAVLDLDLSPGIWRISAFALDKKDRSTTKELPDYNVKESTFILDFTLEQMIDHCRGILDS